MSADRPALNLTPRRRTWAGARAPGLPSRRAGRSIVADLVREVGLQVDRIDQSEERAFRIGIRDHAPGVDLFTARQHHAGRLSIANLDLLHSRARADVAPASCRRRRQGAVSAPGPPLTRQCHPRRCAARMRPARESSRAAARRPRTHECAEDATRRERRAQELVSNHSATRSATAIGTQRSSRYPSLLPSSRNRRPVCSSVQRSAAAGPFDDRRRHRQSGVAMSPPISLTARRKSGNFGVLLREASKLLGRARGIVMKRQRSSRRVTSASHRAARTEHLRRRAIRPQCHA